MNFEEKEEFTREEVESLPPHEFLDALVYFNERYYAGHPVISDSLYDELERSFREQYPELADQIPVGTSLDEFEKVEHPLPMGSLPKIRSEDSVESWEAEHGNEGEIVYQPKFDGCAVELIYEDGHLRYMLTRGEGDEGEDVTHVAKVLNMVPNFVPEFEYTDDLVVLRGEAVLYKEDHPNEARRNLATGSLKSLDPTVAVDRNLQIYVHTLTQFADGYEDYEYEERLDVLDDLGFKVTPVYHSFEDYDEPWFDVPYDVDGVVIKTVNGEENSGIAYKFPEDTYFTKVEGVNFQFGKTRKITPVLQVEPVEADGRTLENVSLGSYDILKEANIGVGDKVEVAFANDIIPHLESVVERTDSERIRCDECPKCGGPVEMDGSHLYCTNEDSEEFLKTRFRSMVHSIGVDGLGGTKVTDLGELYDWNFTRMIKDFDSSGRPPRELRDLDGWGKKTTKSVWRQVVDTIKDMSWANLYRILDVEGFGWKTRKKYLRANPDDPYPMTRQKLLNTPGVQGKTADKILDSFENRRDIAETLLRLGPDEPDLGVRLEEPSGPLDGVQVFVTGSLEFGTRSEFKEFVKERGADWGKSQDAILVTNDPNSSSNKAEYAREHDLEILTEDEFFERFGLGEGEEEESEEGATLEDFA